MKTNLKENNLRLSVKDSMESIVVLFGAKESSEAECYGAWLFKKVS